MYAAANAYWQFWLANIFELPMIYVFSHHMFSFTSCQFRNIEFGTHSHASFAHQALRCLEIIVLFECAE